MRVSAVLDCSTDIDHSGPCSGLPLFLSPCLHFSGPPIPADLKVSQTPTTPGKPTKKKKKKKSSMSKCSFCDMHDSPVFDICVSFHFLWYFL